MNSEPMSSARTSAEAGPAVGGCDRAQARRGAGDGGDGGGVRQVPLQPPLLQVQLLEAPQQLVAPLLQMTYQFYQFCSSASFLISISSILFSPSPSV